MACFSFTLALACGTRRKKVIGRHLERLNKETDRHLHLVPACHVFESTFKNQASTALEEASSQIQDQASTALEEISNKVRKQASTALEEISSLVQDQASTALGSTPTVRDFKTHLLHVTNTCIRRALKWGHL